MYTQCPECGAAFRVTAQVLKQAAGMVRCGGCGHAFNALDYLSEEKPAPKEPEIPELMPELPETGTTAYVKAITDIPEEALSPDQSAELMEKLDDLSGESKDVRIEDTGVEWRVLDDESADQGLQESEQEPADSLLSDPGVTSAYYVGDAFNFDDDGTQVDAEHRDVFEGHDQTFVDEAGVFDGSSTSIDEILNEAPTPLDAVIPEDELHGPEASAEELVSREDLLIEDSDLDEEPFGPSEGTIVEEVLDESATDDADSAETESPEFGPDEGTIVEEGEAEQIEISEDSFEIDDNTDDEAVEPAESDAGDTAAEVVEPEPVEEELRFDDNTPLPDSFLDDFSPDDSSEEEPQDETDEPQVAELVDESLNQKIDIGDPNEWQSLLDDFGDLLATDLKAPEITEDEEPPADQEAPSQASVDDDAGDWQEAASEDPEAEPEPDVAEPEHAEEAVADDESDDEPGQDHSDEDERPDHVEQAGEADGEPEPEPEPTEVDAAESDDTDADDDDQEQIAAEADAPAEESADEAEAASDGEESDDQEDTDDTDSVFDDLLDLEVTDDSSDDVYTNEGLPEVLDVATGEAPEADNDSDTDSGNDDDHGFDIPPETEEEQTINRMIDQDLLAIAHQDEDGFTSTIVFDKDDPAADFDNITIGTDEDGNEVVAENHSDDAEAENEASPEPAVEEEPAAADSTPEEDHKGTSKRLGLIAAVICLGIGLGGQYVHLNRADLATSPTFAGVLLPLYESIGMPITPDWDVNAWAFETSRENFDNASQSLTIDTRISNGSDASLPYPIITVAVTDIYMEPVGRLVLEPAEYLDDQSLAAGQVSPGERFETRIVISDLPETAENYLLKACYRLSGDELRCDNQSFR